MLWAAADAEKTGLVSSADVDRDLRKLLIEFGPQRRSYHPEYPFWRLRNDFQCAVCGFNVRVGDLLVALETAHINWRQAGGPDSENYGVALCAMHHKLFDRGAFTITEDMKVQVSEKAHGTSGFDEWLMKFHGEPL
jgi:putative restriction endonuclease